MLRENLIRMLQVGGRNAAQLLLRAEAAGDPGEELGNKRVTIDNDSDSDSNSVTTVNARGSIRRDHRHSE
jgi:hypothetical protein